MNRRRVLNGIHRQMARKQGGVNAVAWFNAQSFHQSTDVPFERLSIADLDRAGARLLPTPETTKPATDSPKDAQ